MAADQDETSEERFVARLARKANVFAAYIRSNGPTVPLSMLALNNDVQNYLLRYPSLQMPKKYMDDESVPRPKPDEPLSCPLIGACIKKSSHATGRLQTAQTNVLSNSHLKPLPAPGRRLFVSRINSLTNPAAAKQREERRLLSTQAKFLSAVRNGQRHSTSPQPSAPSPLFYYNSGGAANIPLPDGTSTADFESSIPITFEIEHPLECHKFCTCACHRRNSTVTSTFLDNIYQLLFRIQGTGIPVVSKASCSETYCAAAEQQPKSRFTYFLQPFLVAEIVDAVLWNNYLLDPPLCLPIRNVLHTLQHEIFRHVRESEPEQVLQELSLGRARISDIDHEGDNMAFLAVACERWETLKLLLRIGIDPYSENPTNVSAYDRAWEMVFTRYSPEKRSSKESKIREIFPSMKRMFTRWRLSRLHKIVMRLIPGDAEFELQNNAAIDINARDHCGRTALYWACGMGGIDTVRTLLDHGASPDISDYQGSSPLRRSMDTHHYDIHQLLVDRGADLNWKNKNGLGGIHVCALYGNPIKVMNVYKHLDINARAGWSGNTPLLMATSKGNALQTEWLLQHGADPHVLPGDGTPEPPLAKAISANNADCTRILLAHGARLDFPPGGSYGCPLLFIAASSGSKDLFNAIAAHAQTALKDIDLLSPRPSTGVTVAGVMRMGGWERGDKVALRRLLLAKHCARCALDARAGIPADFSVREASDLRTLARLPWLEWPAPTALAETPSPEDRRVITGSPRDWGFLPPSDEARRRATPHTHGVPPVPRWVLQMDENDLRELEWVVESADGSVVRRRMFPPPPEVAGDPLLRIYYRVAELPPAEKERIEEWVTVYVRGAGDDSSEESSEDEEEDEESEESEEGENSGNEEGSDEGEAERGDEAGSGSESEEGGGGIQEEAG